MARRKSFPKRIDSRRDDAKVRQEERIKRGDAGQLARLQSRGFGTCKEAARLATRLTAK